MKTTFELLSDLDIKYFCALFNINLKNVLLKDEFINVTPQIGCYVINLDDTTSGRGGTHWTCLIITSSHCIIYFDPFGLPIPYPIKLFIKKYKHQSKIIYSTDDIQYIDSIFCGWFCIYFMYFITVLHSKNNNYGYLLNKHNTIYNLQNKYLNDKILRNLIKQISF